MTAWPFQQASKNALFQGKENAGKFTRKQGTYLTDFLSVKMILLIFVFNLDHLQYKNKRQLGEEEDR